MLEQPQQNEVHCRASACAVRGLSRAARFSKDFTVLAPPACPVANVAKQLGVPITEARRAVRTGRVLACLTGASAILRVPNTTLVRRHTASVHSQGRIFDCASALRGSGARMLETQLLRRTDICPEFSGGQQR